MAGLSIEWKVFIIKKSSVQEVCPLVKPCVHTAEIVNKTLPVVTHGLQFYQINLVLLSFLSDLGLFSSFLKLRLLCDYTNQVCLVRRYIKKATDLWSLVKNLLK